MRRSALLLVIALIAAVPVPGRASTSSATMYRDQWGVPHVYADSAEAAAYALGWAQAEDHLEGMLRIYATATGRQAELLGPGCLPNCALVDLRMRQIGIPEAAARWEIDLGVEERSWVIGFSAGANAYMAEHPEDVPAWFQGDVIVPSDVVAWAQLAVSAHELQIAEGKLNAALAPDPEQDQYLPLDGLPAQGASNMWAIGPSKTVAGNAIMHGDPHLPWYGGNAWYEQHMVYPGVDVAGAQLWGAPGIAMGTTQGVSWSMTNNNADPVTADVYRLIVTPGAPVAYLHDGVPKPMSVREDIMYVRTADGLIPVPLTHYASHHGPVVLFAGNYAYAYRLSLHDQNGAVAQLLEMNKAQTVEQLFAAWEDLRFSKWNVVAADTAGTIGYRYNVRAVQKDLSYNWDRPVPGWTSATDPGAVITDIPQGSDPPEGFYQNSNNAPWSTDRRLDRADYPWLVPMGLSLGARGERADETIAAHDEHTLETNIAIGMDTVSLTARKVIPILIEEYDARAASIADPDGKIAEMIDVLRGWDFSFQKDQAGATVAQAWWHEARGAGLSFADWGSDLTLKPGDRDVMIAALPAGRDVLLERHGRIDVPWGDAHAFDRGGLIPVAGGANSLSGINGFSTLYMTNLDRISDGKLLATSGSSYLMDVEMSTPPVFRSSKPLSQSEDPSSPHYRDVTLVYADQAVKTLPLTRADVEAAATSEQTFTIGTLEPATRELVRARAPSTPDVPDLGGIPLPIPTNEPQAPDPDGGVLAAGVVVYSLGGITPFLSFAIEPALGTQLAPGAFYFKYRAAAVTDLNDVTASGFGWWTTTKDGPTLTFEGPCSRSGEFGHTCSVTVTDGGVGGTDEVSVRIDDDFEATGVVFRGDLVVAG